MTMEQVDFYLHSLLAALGFVLTIVRLRILSRPHASFRCHLRWWVWVICHAMFAIGFFTIMVRPFDPSIEMEPRFNEWFFQLGILGYLILRIKQRPLSDTTTKD